MIANIAPRAGVLGRDVESEDFVVPVSIGVLLIDSDIIIGTPSDG